MPRRLTGAPAAAAGIALSRAAGLVRAALTTNILGVGTVGDAFAAALRIPNVLQNLLGEGALSAAFVPEYSSRVDASEEDAGRLAGAVASFLLILTGSLVLVGMVGARPLTRLIAWGYEGERFDLTVQLVRIIMIGTGLLVLASWCLGVLNSHRRFFLSYVAPVLWNAVQIAVLVVVVSLGWTRASVATALGWAIVAGAAAQLLVQVPAVLRANPHIRLARPFGQDDSRRVIRRFGPAVLGRGAMQLSGFLDLALATLLSVGAAAAMAASQFLYILPISIVGISVVAAELPELSRLQDPTSMARRVEHRLTQTGFIISGVVAVYLAASGPLVDSLFNLGGFRERIAPDDVTLIALTLSAYSLGLPALVASRILQNVCYSAGDTSTPARIALVRIAVSLLVGASLMFPLDRVLVTDGGLTGFGDLTMTFSSVTDAVRHDPSLPARLGAVGLAVGAAVGAWIELAMLRTWVLRQWRRPRLTASRSRRSWLPPIVATVLGSLVAVTTTVDQPLVDLVLVGTVVGVVHLGLGVALRCEGAQQLVSTLRHVRSTAGSGEKDAP
jgi:putative peptidoglycan lipid II flippase